jgi:hypothetical protein
MRVGAQASVLQLASGIEAVLAAEKLNTLLHTYLVLLIKDVVDIIV